MIYTSHLGKLQTNFKYFIYFVLNQTTAMLKNRVGLKTKVYVTLTIIQYESYFCPHITTYCANLLGYIHVYIYIYIYNMGNKIKLRRKLCFLIMILSL